MRRHILHWFKENLDEEKRLSQLDNNNSGWQKCTLPRCRSIKIRMKSSLALTRLSILPRLFSQIFNKFSSFFMFSFRILMKDIFIATYTRKSLFSHYFRHGLEIIDNGRDRIAGRGIIFIRGFLPCRCDK